jgi:hypothetical protein
MKTKAILLALVFASIAMVQAKAQIKFTSYDSPTATVHRSGASVENIVINKADATDAGLQQLGRQLYALSTGYIVYSIGIYTSVWAATNGTSLEDMSKADQLRFGKDWGELCQTW